MAAIPSFIVHCNMDCVCSEGEQMTTSSSIASIPTAELSTEQSRQLRARFAAWRAERRRRARLALELSRLDARDLADLGISRADFPAIIRGTYCR